MNDVIELPNGQTVRVRARGWVTRPEAEFLNSLCPVSNPAFPRLIGNEVSQAAFKSAFKEGFQAVQQLWEANLFSAPDNLSRNELKVWLAIRWKTLAFGKLFEKIPEQHFLYGLTGNNGELIISCKNFHALPPTGIADRRNLFRAIKGLAQKTYISRARSERHPSFGQSYVYSPLPISSMLDTFFEVSFESFAKRERRHAPELWPAMLQLVNRRCSEFFRETDYEIKTPNWSSIV
jgi:hypothetical protein